MPSLVNSGDPDEMPLDGSTLFAKTKMIFRESNTIESCQCSLKIITCEAVAPRYIHMTIPSLLYQSRKKKLFVHKGLGLLYRGLKFHSLARNYE